MAMQRTHKESWRVQLVRVAQALLGAVVKLALLSLASLILSIVIVVGITSFWAAYTDTQVGQRFLKTAQSAPQVMTFLAGVDVLPFALYVNTAALVVSLLVACASKFLYLKRFLYDQSVLVFGIIFWGAANTLGTAYLLHDRLDLRLVDTAPIVLLPCFLFLKVCFDARHGHWAVYQSRGIWSCGLANQHFYNTTTFEKPDGVRLTEGLMDAKVVPPPLAMFSTVCVDTTEFV